ncbi:CD36-like protein [Euroglyphus maynei]|uniref:Scavenger receptor class B member 1 n=1 Tax=Euroglyphus maynei TaxID=6958 RepID=A0A1Y3B6D5_EURMA|nr:CD36-like protein [Euroglyphus maynei]
MGKNSKSFNQIKSNHQSIEMANTKCSIISLPKIKVIPLPELIDHHEPFFGDIIRKISGVANVDRFDLIRLVKIKEKQKRKQNECWQFLQSSLKFIIILTIAMITIFSYFFFDPIINNAIESRLNLDENSQMINSWQQPSFPYTMKFYIFGLKNAADFLQGEQPILLEYGPFVYHVDTKRTITKWKSDTIQYTEQSFYHFDHNHSLPLDTELTVLNYPLLSALYMKSILGFLTPVVQNVVSNVIQSSGEKIIEQRQAADLLDGHRVKFFKNVQRLLKPMKALGIKFGPELENFDFEHYSFGFGPQNSGQKSELYEHFRHTENGHLFDGIYKVGGKRKLKDFRPPCNEMSGSSGIFFGMHLTAPEISFFSHSVCRKILVRYFVDVELFNSTYQSNRCYCLQSKLSKCQGWIDTSPCLGQLQVGSSFPHFYNSLRRQKTVIGLRPDYSKHIGYLDVEPNIGIPINGQIGIQFNMRISSIPIIGLQSIHNTLLPMFWAEQSNQIQSPMIYWLMIISLSFTYGKYFIFFIGTFITLIWFYQFFKRR